MALLFDCLFLLTVLLTVCSFLCFVNVLCHVNVVLYYVSPYINEDILILREIAANILSFYILADSNITFFS